jgi:hypothetical protein
MNMQTDQLVHALAADHPTQPAPPGRVLALALAGGVVVAAAMFLGLLGPRGDIMAALATPRFLLKFVETGALAATALALALRLMRPGAPTSRAALGLAAAPGILLLAVIAELMLIPPEAWAARLVGANARICMTFIPVLALPLLAAALLALRHGAPTRPALTGAVAGLLAGGLAATLYAAHCPDDSPLFVATWYTLAIALSALAGALVGARFLRW